MGAGPEEVTKHFEPIPWNIDTVEDMQMVLDFGHRLRLTPLAKELLKLPCMRTEIKAEGLSRRVGEKWRENYAVLGSLPESEHVRLAALQEENLMVSREEGALEVEEEKPQSTVADDARRHASFGAEASYARPSAYIKELVVNLPATEQLTRDQTLFMVRFAKACDDAWDDDEKPPEQRQVHHLLLLGQGGSGKTHVVQKLVFDAVNFIWPPKSPEDPTLMVVAFSNAQAKNISTARVKARTLHSATGMRVQQLINPLMRPGNKQKHLTRLWEDVHVLIIEEISMVSAACYNMLDFRSMHGRARTYSVSESTYKLPNHHFGRTPIVIHLGDFLQLSPTASTAW